MTSLKISASKLPGRLFNFLLIKSWLKYVPVLLLVFGLADVQAQALPDATQDFTGYSNLDDGTNRWGSPDGFFIISASDNEIIDADEFGAYLWDDDETGNKTEWMEISVNPSSDLGSFRIGDAHIGEYMYSGISTAEFENVFVTAYQGETEVASTSPYTNHNDGEDNEYLIDYSVFDGLQVDRFRITFTSSAGTPIDAFNLVNFTIANSSTEAPASSFSLPTVSTSSVSSITATGATLLSGILKQNPEFLVDMSSPIGSLINGVPEQIGAGIKW